MTTSPFPNRIPWFRLGEYQSKSSGRPYLVGYLGDAKIVILLDPTAEPSMKGALNQWNAFVEPAPPRKGGKK